MKLIIAMCALYRELVGERGESDVPVDPPLVGHYFCPVSTWRGHLWASIRFGHLRGDERRRSASLLIYMPGAGGDGEDVRLLEIQVFVFPDGERNEIFPHFQQMSACDHRIIAECLHATARFEELIPV